MKKNNMFKDYKNAFPICYRFIKPKSILPIKDKKIENIGENVYVSKIIDFNSNRSLMYNSTKPISKIINDEDVF